MKGFNTAFKCHEKDNFRELPEEFRVKKKYKPLTSDEIKKILEESQVRKFKMENQLHAQGQERDKLNKLKNQLDTLKYSAMDESSFLAERSIYS